MESRTMELATYVYQDTVHLDYINVVLKKLKHYKGNRIPIPWGDYTHGNLMVSDSGHNSQYKFNGAYGYTGQWGVNRLYDSAYFDETLLQVYGNIRRNDLVSYIYNYGDYPSTVDLTSANHFTLLSGQNNVATQYIETNLIELEHERELLSAFIVSNDVRWGYSSDKDGTTFIREYFNVKTDSSDMESYHVAFSIRRYPNGWCGTFPSYGIMTNGQYNRGETVLVTCYSYSNNEYSQFFTHMINGGSNITYSTNYII